MPLLDPLSEPALAPWLDRFVDARVLVVGDIMLDRYVGGEVRRISPEAPIPVLRAQTRRSVLGGAGNVAQNIAALGGQALLIGVVGRDEAANEIATIVAGTQAISARLVPAPRPSSVKTRFMSGSHPSSPSTPSAWAHDDRPSILRPTLVWNFWSVSRSAL